jgi:hypothetical protein
MFVAYEANDMPTPGLPFCGVLRSLAKVYAEDVSRKATRVSKNSTFRLAQA